MTNVYFDVNENIDYLFWDLNVADKFILWTKY